VGVKLADRAILFSLGVLYTSSALAFDNGQYDKLDPQIRAWVKGLHDNVGVSCCDTADGYPTEAEWDNDTGKYRVKIDGAWIPVPDHTVVGGPNRLGYAVVWYIKYVNTVVIRCFLPGPTG
jgi:hypothetical protein